MKLEDLGWKAPQDADARRLHHDDIRRVISVGQGLYLVDGGPSSAWLPISGTLLSAEARPVVGDWVVTHQGVITQFLERHSRLSRKAPGTTSAEQVICANVDRVFVVTAIGHDFSANRVQRYCAASFAAGAQPVVIVNKVDQTTEREQFAAELSQAVPDVDIVCMSATTGQGWSELESHLHPTETVVFVGSSGVGKSTIVNRIMGEALQPTQAVRADDDKGRHTTTSRNLLRAPSGVLVIDTPGMREFGLASGDGLDEIFSEIQELAQDCRFRDCQHHDEPGCAIADAIATGRLATERFEHYDALRREAQSAEMRASTRVAHNQKRAWRDTSKSIRDFKKLHRKLGIKDY